MKEKEMVKRDLEDIVEVSLEAARKAPEEWHTLTYKIVLQSLLDAYVINEMEEE